VAKRTRNSTLNVQFRAPVFHAAYLYTQPIHNTQQERGSKNHVLFDGEARLKKHALGSMNARRASEHKSK
jgi:hypothetical protein